MPWSDSHLSYVNKFLRNFLECVPIHYSVPCSIFNFAVDRVFYRHFCQMLIRNILNRIVKGFLLNDIPVFDELLTGKGKEFGGRSLQYSIRKLL